MGTSSSGLWKVWGGPRSRGAVQGPGGKCAAFFQGVGGQVVGSLSVHQLVPIPGRPGTFHNPFTPSTRNGSRPAIALTVDDNPVGLMSETVDGSCPEDRVRERDPPLVLSVGRQRGTARGESEGAKAECARVDGILLGESGHQ